MTHDLLVHCQTGGHFIAFGLQLPVSIREVGNAGGFICLLLLGLLSNYAKHKITSFIFYHKLCKIKYKNV